MARARADLARAEAELLRRALRQLSQAQDAYVRAHGAWGAGADAPVHALRDAERRFDVAVREASRWRAALDDARGA